VARTAVLVAPLADGPARTWVSRAAAVEQVGRGVAPAAIQADGPAALTEVSVVSMEKEATLHQ
jgi:hypothetical protein